MSEFKNLSQEQGSIFELETHLLRQHDVLKLTLPMGILNLDGTLLEINQALCDLIGYQSRDIVGKHFTEFTHPDDIETSVKYFHRLASGKEENYTVEERYICKDGHIVYANVHKFIIRDSENAYMVFSAEDVTDRKQVEEALLESENKYRTLFEKSADAILIIEDDKFVDCNLATVKMFGYKDKKDLLETHPSELSPKIQADGRSSFEKANEILSTMFDLGSHRFEWDHKRQNGEVFPVEVLLTAFPFGEKKIIHTVLRDITERKQTEEILRESNERFRAAFSDAAIGMLLASLDHRIIEANQAFCNMIGYSKDELVGVFFKDITHPNDIDVSLEYHHKLIAEEIDNYHVEKRYLHKQGHEVWGDLSVSLVRDKDAAPIYAVAQIQDITKRKQAEKALYESENKYRTLFEQSADANLILEGDKFVDCNPATIKMLGYKNKEELLETHPSELSPEMQADGKSSLEKANELMSIAHAQGSHCFEWDHKRQNGEVFPVEVTLTSIPFGERNVLHAVWRDITERKQVEGELQKLSRAVEYSSSAVYITNLDGNIEYVNPKFAEITGYTREEAIGQNTRILKSGETLDGVYDDLWETISSGGEWKGEFHNRKKDGSLYWSRASISGVKDAQGKITHFISIEEDVTHEHKLTEQLSHQASHDSLTGLVNRREFERRAERLLSTIQQDKGEHALCYLDLDQFKVVNDTCGHAAGDELLRQLTSVLKGVVRKRDTLARLGGDEFGVLMEHCSLDDAYRVATSLQKTIQEYQFVWEGHSFRVGVSIGLVPITSTTATITQLLKNADAACYMAKELGRSRIHVYDTEDSEIAQRHGEMQWVTRLNQALEEDRFCLYAQAIVPLNGSTDKHYELLIRMIDEKGEIILPGAFLPAAERYSLISKIDRWVIEHAFGLLSENQVFLKQINFCSINLSGPSLTDPEILEFIITQLKEAGVPGEKICFEITETAAISNLSTAMKFISTLKRFGCQFALDDFGSGLSSFRYLKNLPVDYLKIDGMFVKNIVDDPIDHAMVKSINEIGHVMGMQTVAEFVENDEIKGMLEKIGVNFVQGYGIGKPQPFYELLGKSSHVRAQEILPNHSPQTPTPN